MRRVIRSQILLVLAGAGPVAAQGWIEPDGPRIVDVRLASPVVRVGSSVRATVDGRVARFEVEERFRNTGGAIAEGVYLYPLPGEAVFTDYSLFQGDTELKGEMMAAEQALAIYENIVRRRKDPALLTLAGHGLIRAQVFPIQPGETRTVTLRFTQLLAREGDALRLRYAAGDRGDAPVTLRVDLQNGDTYATPYSPTHQVESALRDGILRLTVAPPVRGDVELMFPVRRGLVSGSVLAHAPRGEDGFVLLLLAPPAGSREAAAGRDLTLVVDVSGSMSGQKMEQARAALRQALGALNPRDRFRVITFSNGVRSFRDGFAAATPETVAEARRFVDGLVATGGTNLAGAIETALGERGDNERRGVIVLLTDGLPSVGEMQPDRIAATAAGRIGTTRVFTVGIGHDVNTYLLDRLAVEGRGSATYVPPGADVETAVGGILTKLSHPALVDLRIVDAPVRFAELAPGTLPDLFYGEELVVLARYQGQGDGPVVIEGTRNGRRERFSLAGRFPRQDDRNEFIPPLWAARRVGELTRQIRLEGRNPELISRIRDLGLRYGILTEYTSYLVLEPGALADRRPDAAPPAGATRAGQMTGERAFNQARASAAMGAAKSLRDAELEASFRLEEAVVTGGFAGGAAAPATKRAGGRVFALRGDVWTDLAHRDSLPVTTILPFSRAYFALLRARPALRHALTAGAPIIVAGRRASLKVADGGEAEWGLGRLERFLREFDGT